MENGLLRILVVDYVFVSQLKAFGREIFAKIGIIFTLSVKTWYSNGGRLLWSRGRGVKAKSCGFESTPEDIGSVVSSRTLFVTA